MLLFVERFANFTVFTISQNFYNPRNFDIIYHLCPLIIFVIIIFLSFIQLSEFLQSKQLWHHLPYLSPHHFCHYYHFWHLRHIRSLFLGFVWPWLSDLYFVYFVSFVISIATVGVGATIVQLLVPSIVTTVSAVTTTIYPYDWSGPWFADCEYTQPNKNKGIFP